MLLRLLALMTLMLCALASQATMDIFMKVDGIQGDSTDAKHRNEISLTSYTFNMAQPVNVRDGRPTGRTAMMPFVVTKYIDIASPRLAQAAINGEHLKQVTITVRRAGGKLTDFLRFTMKDVLLSSYLQENTQEGVLPKETIQFTFTNMEMEYFPQNPDGSAGTPVRMQWDAKQNPGA